MSTATRNLLLLGDNEKAEWHPLEPARQQLAELLGEAFQLNVTEDYNALSGLSSVAVDAVVSYADCWSRSIEPEQAAGLLSYVAGGGGLLVIHNGISLQNSYELAQLIGGKFTTHPDYQTLHYYRSAPEHPLLQDVSDFTVDEEPYMFEFDSFAPRNVFLEYEFEGKRYPAAWEHRYGLGRVVYLQPGHCEPSFKPEAYRQLIRNSASWAAGSR
ncbi:ThuA domain-containing protein [Paenibacillus gorillae]|uniref:ThuA domain-containing protein n=1 Tax=Paenibacillus gorillae TaxID=1243662 RepID=UPI0004B65670|nr:ThuA domain-containing protein [Paenibacillus gorillae]